jgi:hypothetical protein
LADKDFIVAILIRCRQATSVRDEKLFDCEPLRDNNFCHPMKEETKKLRDQMAKITRIFKFA